MHWDKCQGCERWRWDYQWRANGCWSNLCASFSLTHCLPLEAPLTSLRDCGLFTDHWLNASFSFPSEFPGHMKRTEVTAKQPLSFLSISWMEKNKKKNKINKKLEYLLLSCFCLWVFFFPEIRTCLFVMCCFPQRVKNSPVHSKRCFMVSDSFQRLLTNNARWNTYIDIKLPSFIQESTFRKVMKPSITLRNKRTASQPKHYTPVSTYFDSVPCCLLTCFLYHHFSRKHCRHCQLQCIWLKPLPSHY